MKFFPRVAIAALGALMIATGSPAFAQTSSEPLAAPADVVATQSGTDIVVTWAAVAGATQYTVVADPGGQTCTSATTSCVFAGLPSKVSYTFAVTATDGARTSDTSLASPPVFLRAKLAEPIFDTDSVLVGRSVRGRPIRARMQGDPLSVNVLLVVGQMHGSEPAGVAVTKRVQKMMIGPDADYQLWTVRTMNPDGAARRNRYNAHTVDLNRNFPGTWSRQAYTGARAASEPETRSMMRFIRRLQPTGVLTIHQPWDTTLSVCDARSAYWVRRVAMLAGLRPPGQPTNCSGWLPGTMNRWVARHTTSWFVTVELAPSHRVGPQIPRMAETVITVAGELGAGGTSPGGVSF